VPPGKKDKEKDKEKDIVYSFTVSDADSEVFSSSQMTALPGVPVTWHSPGVESCHV